MAREGQVRVVDDLNSGTLENIQHHLTDGTLEMTSHQAEIVTRLDMPTGPLNRVADNSLARKLLEWELKVSFRDGLRRTIEWYFAAKDREHARRVLDEGGLIERKVVRTAKC